MKTLMQLTLVLCVCACGSNQPDDELYLKEMTKAFHPTEQHDTIFLGYRFGMSEAEFDEHTTTLLQKGVLYTDDDKLRYRLVTNSSSKELTGSFAPSYFHGKLYELAVAFKSGETSDDPMRIQAALEAVYMPQYGQWLKISNPFTGAIERASIQGNRLVHLFQGLNDARVFFVDVPVQHQKKLEEARN